MAMLVLGRVNLATFPTLKLSAVFIQSYQSASIEKIPAVGDSMAILR